MSQEDRRRTAAWRLLDPPPHSNAEVPEPLQIRRFSLGLEHPVLDRLRPPHIGRFSDGQQRSGGDERIGRFSRGQDDDRELAHLHVGRFGDAERRDA